MTDTATLLKHSVTAGDQADGPRTGGHYYFLAPTGQSAPGLPPYWSFGRDYALRRTTQMEAMWASAIYKAITKQAALGFTVKDSADSTLRVRRGQELFLAADSTKGLSRGWVPFVYKHLRSYLLTDNGAFVEIIRATGAAGSRILGIAHLDPLRCIRTGDPEIPVLYRDLKGREHEMKAYQVFALSDMPDDSETWFGVGYCAASRAWDTIRKMSYIEQYISEKVSGSRNLAIHIVSGISEKSLNDALASADQEQARRGRVVYRGALVVPSVKMDANISLVTIPLAEIPDGFEAETERRNAYTIYANAIGVAVQDIQPLSGQGLGTGTQSVILDEAAEGQGLASWRKSWEQFANEWLLPDTTTFAFATNDIRDQKAKAEVSSMRANTRASQVQIGEITPEQALQMAVDAGDAPREFLAVDETAGGSLSDTEKPLTEASVEAERLAQGEEAEVTGDEVGQAILTKATRRVSREDAIALLDDDELLARAKALYEEARGDA
jgi:hypothetical protein